MNYGEIVAGMFGLGFVVVYLAIIIFYVVAQWRMFEKAGKPGWACIVPIYNLIVMCEIGGVNPVLILLFLVPIANIVIGIMITYKMYNAYVSEGWAILGIFLPIIVTPYIAFSSDVSYVGPAN